MLAVNRQLVVLNCGACLIKDATAVNAVCLQDNFGFEGEKIKVE